jgi:F-type H+-transporting ATPase subunit epsilon
MAEDSRIRLEIVTPTEHAFDGAVDVVNAPGIIGEFGVLPNHRPMLSATRSGVVYYREGEREEVLVVGPGFAEIEPDHVILLTDRCEKAVNIDPDDARKEFEELDEKYKAFSGDTTTTEFEELERDYQWAEASLDAAKRISK